MEISEKRCWKGYKPTPGKKPYSKGSCMKESYKLIGKVLLEAGYKGIQFNRFGSDDDVLPVSARRFLVKRHRKKDDMYVADKKNVDRAAKGEFEKLLTLPSTNKEIEDFLKRSPEYNRDEVINRAKDEVSSHLSRNLSDLERSTRRAYSDKGKPRLYGLATLGPRGEAFIGRPQKSKIDPKTEKVVEVPYSRRTRQNQREAIGHEAAHVRLSRLPGILSKLGSSETLASAYGGFRAPVRGSSFMSRLRSAGRRVRDYGLPEDLKSIRKSIAGMLPSRFRKAQRESYELIGRVIAEAKKGVMPKMKMGVHKSRAGGLTQKGVEAYRRANPGSKLKTAVTTKPSKLKKGSKSAKRRKSFCARMGGMKKRLTSSKTASDPNSRINKALRKWNC